jgi:hypothetical protein
MSNASAHLTAFLLPPQKKSSQKKRGQAKMLPYTLAGTPRFCLRPTHINPFSISFAIGIFRDALNSILNLN